MTTFNQPYFWVTGRRRTSQHWGESVFAVPLVEPISLDEAKAQCRGSDSPDENELIQSLIVTAREDTEDLCGRVWISQTRDYVLDDGFPGGEEPIQLPRLPLVSVTSITYVDTAGASQVWSSTLYDVDTVTGRIAPKYSQVYPSTQRQINAVTVRFVCGYATPALVPARAKQAMKLLISYWWMHRGDDMGDETERAVRQAVEAILGPLRKVVVA